MNFNFSNTPLGRLRMAGIIEGFSFLILLFIAMPLKYILHLPEAVKIMGWIHGLLFVFFMVTLINVKFSLKWSLMRSFMAFLSSLIPFGTFVLDKQWRKEEKESLDLAAL